MTLKAEKVELEAEILFVENWIDNYVKDSVIVQVGEKQFKTTPVRSYTTKVDAARMTRLVPEVANRVIRTETVEKVDNDLLAREIEKGNIPTNLMTQFISRTPKKTSIRITEYVAHEEDEDADE